MRELDLTILSKLRQQTSKNTPRVSIVGQKFNRWTVFGLMGYAKTDSAMSYWLCRCTCGNWKIVAKGKLKSGLSKSCGCWNDEVRGKASITHGLAKTPAHRRWTDMFTRCFNPNFKQYADWGGRGITVCQGFRQFENFYAALGQPPTQHLLDRIENNGNYSCGKCEECLSKNWLMNVHWVPRKISARNKRNNVLLTTNGKTRCVAEWAEILGLNPLLIAKRKRAGWPDDECLGFKERPSADRYRRKP